MKKRNRVILALCMGIMLVGFGLSQALAAKPVDFAQESGPKNQSKKEAVRKEVVKGKVTTDDVARYLGKVPPSEQAAAAKRLRQQGMLPGNAGRAAQALKEGKDE